MPEQNIEPESAKRRNVDQSTGGQSSETPANPITINETPQARRPNHDQIVQRATRGLIRVQWRRRIQATGRRIVILIILALVGFGCWHLVKDQLPYPWFQEIWDDLATKIGPLIQSDDTDSRAGQ